MRAHDRDTFIRLANLRVPKAIKALSLVGNLANRSNYDYKDTDVEKILKTLDQAMLDCKERFAQKPSADRGFRLE